MGISIVKSAGTVAFRLGIAAAVITGTTACSPGTLPGAPSSILVGGGAGRYNGSITYRRVGGNFTISETPQAFNLSLVLRQVDQITGRFESGESNGSVQGVLTGDLAAGSFLATIVVSTLARQASGAAVTCEGRGEVTGTLSGRNLSWTVGSIIYDNCPGLAASSAAQAVAVSPVPGEFTGRANVVITIVGGATVRRSTCATGNTGYRFTVDMVETAGIDVTFDSSFLVEERRNFGPAMSASLDMPFRDLKGGTRRSYEACSPTSGTYQAFFSGSDANGNRFRVGTSLVTFVP
jgi:hypothetical protein